METKYYSRGFLNESEGMAAFEASVCVSDWDEDGFFDASFKLSDCYKQVTLDFSVYEIDGVNKMTAKVDNLIIHLNRFKNALVTASKHTNATDKKAAEGEVKLDESMP